jgi:predicted dehydrogenase
MTQTVYRVGIAGAGFGVKAHLPALIAHPRFEVVALASPATAAKVAAERGIAASFSSAREMVHGVDLDAVVVASPPFAHHHDVLSALERRKHVLCEKPFALNVAQARDMVDAARQAGTVCGMSHEFRFVSAISAVKELAANGHLDPLRDVEVTYLRPMLHRTAQRERSWWFDRARGGGIGGAMLSHIVDLADWICARSPQRSMGFLRTANRTRTDPAGTFESTVDDGAFALLEYEGGAVARVSADATASVDGFTLAVHGEDRTAVASGSNITDLTLYTLDGEETNELECRPSPYAKFASINPNVPLLMELYDEFAKALDGQPNALPTFAEALTTQEVLASIGYTT